MPATRAREDAINTRTRRATHARTGLFQMRNEKSGDFFCVSVEPRVAAHNLGAVEASDVKKTRASLQQKP